MSQGIEMTLSFLGMLDIIFMHHDIWIGNC